MGPSKTPLVGMCGILVLRGNVLDGLDESGLPPPQLPILVSTQHLVVIFDV